MQPLEIHSQVQRKTRRQVWNDQNLRKVSQNPPPNFNNQFDLDFLGIKSEYPETIEPRIPDTINNPMSKFPSIDQFLVGTLPVKKRAVTPSVRSKKRSFQKKPKPIFRKKRFPWGLKSNTPFFEDPVSGSIIPMNKVLSEKLSKQRNLPPSFFDPVIQQMTRLILLFKIL